MYRRTIETRSRMRLGPHFAVIALLALLAQGAVLRSQIPGALGDQNASGQSAGQSSNQDSGWGSAFGSGQGSSQGSGQNSSQDTGAFQDQAGGTSSMANPGLDALSSVEPGLQGTSTPGTTISSDRIISILQQTPDLMVELKELMADRLQEQGVAVSADEISDGMFYSEIQTNPTLRTGIATYLRARGYLTDDESAGAEGSAADESVYGQTGPARGNLPGGMLSLGAANGLGWGQMAGAGGQALPLNQAGSFGANRIPTGAMRPRHEQTNSSTDVPRVLRQAAPYNLQSMRDLYTQVPQSAEHLKRFGSDVFVERSGAVARGASSIDTPLDVPVGPDYVLGPGDQLTIDLWGGTTQSMTRTVDRSGRILLQDTAPIMVAGLTLGRAQEVIEAALKQQYRNAQCVVTATGLRSVRVYMVGDVQQPGGYDISSLATPLSALYAAGGPTSAGSLRTLLHYRGDQLVETVDLYDFLLHGIRNGSAHFESGDTLLVPPTGPQVAVGGAVKRPAIYELKAGELKTGEQKPGGQKTGQATLDEVIADAGGLTAAASPSHVRIERIGANHERVTLETSLAQNPVQNPTQGPAQGSATQNGPIQGSATGTAFPVQDGDRVTVEPILAYSARVVYLEGHVARPGRLAYTDGMRLSDALRSYRDLLPEPAARGEIVRLVAPDLHAETIAFNVPDLLIGNADLNLEPFDTIRVHGRYDADAPDVMILGEVLRPGKYPMSAGMTAAQLVRMAGGFKRDAFLESADLTSYDVTNGQGVAANLTTVRIGAAVNGGGAQADVALKPGDILMIHQMTGWNEIGQSVTIEGQVKYPGSYGFEDGERLSSVLKRAGGFLSNAYPMGAVLVRDQVRDLELKSRDELIRQIETSSSAARLSPTMSGANAGAALEAIKAQQDQVISELRNHPPTGRMVIQISLDIDQWAGTSADIELRRGDVVTIPKRPGFVLVTGQVYNATALTFTPNKTAGWYLGNAGGANATADRKEIFIIRANGSVVGRRSGGWFSDNVLSTRLNPGDVVVVPQKIIGASAFWRNLLVAGQLAASTALTAGVAAATL
jgi:protein involved in polysaccharide export with SLBB domain